MEKNCFFIVRIAFSGRTVCTILRSKECILVEWKCFLLYNVKTVPFERKRKGIKGPGQSIVIAFIVMCVYIFIYNQRRNIDIV